MTIVDLCRKKRNTAVRARARDAAMWPGTSPPPATWLFHISTTLGSSTSGDKAGYSQFMSGVMGYEIGNLRFTGVRKSNGKEI